MIPLHIGLFAAAFLVGGIPTGYIVVKLARNKDVRKQGSGNIGSTNVFRTEGALLGTLVLLVDAGKAFAAAYFLAMLFDQEALLRPLLGLTVISGNIFTPFLRFKGGKGVGAGLGVACAVSPLSALVAVACFAAVVGLTRYVSLGSLAAALVFSTGNFLFYMVGDREIYGFLFSVVLLLAIVIRHTSNIKRLLHGEENKIGTGKARS
ncbi:MAG: glycerol-3-phosphate 1-O-acyltransferase PlsY [Spirochaetota bacterium]